MTRFTGVLNNCARYAGQWVVAAGLLIAFPLMVSADFVSRESTTEIYAFIGGYDEDEKVEKLNMEAEGDCEIDEYENVLNSVQTLTGPEGEADEIWVGGQHECSFAWSHDEAGYLGDAYISESMSYAETWDDEEPSRVVVWGEPSVAFNRAATSEPTEELPRMGAQVKDEYVLDFYIEQEKTYVMRATITDGRVSGSVDADGGRIMGVLRAWIVNPSGIRAPELQLIFSPQDDELHKDVVFTAPPGEYDFGALAVAGTGEAIYLMGEHRIQFNFNIELAECHHVGTAGDDDITGDSSDEIICAKGGDDLIEGGGGRDLIYAGDGEDIVTVGNDPVEIFGGPGNDGLSGGNANDLIFGGEGHDVIEGGAGMDVIYGEDGDDEIDGDEGDDEIYGEAGFDKINGGDGDDLIWGGDKKDVIEGGDGDDFIDGEDGDDILRGDGDEDIIMGGKGRDTILGGRGKDELYGGNANDVIHGEIGGDIIEGGQGHDILNGGPNRDRIIGNGGNDVIEGGTGRERIRGGPGNDVLDIADGEEDFANCGAGTDDASNSDDIVDTLVNCEIVP